MARRKDHNREELKEMILQAAWNIIKTDGSNALSARSIAKEIGYAAGTIYNIYSSMDELQLHINARTLDILKEHLSKEMPTDIQNTQFVPVAIMKKLAASYIQFAHDYRPYWLMLFEHAKNTNEDKTQWYAEKVSELFLPLEQLLSPYYTNEIQLKKSARVLWGSVHGLCFLQETGKITNAAQSTTNNTSNAALDLANTLIETYMAGVSSLNSQ